MAKKSDAQVQADLIDLKLRNETKYHEMRMEELEFVRETEKISHDNATTRMLIKSAEIKKAFDRKQANQYPRGKQW